MKVKEPRVLLRQKQMLERKCRILDAAEVLIRETGETNFSVRVLAATAEVSPATPFNLFGSKEGILYDLLLRSLDKVTLSGLSFKSKDQAFHVVEAAENAVSFFLDDPLFLRPLYQVLLGVSHPVHRPIFMKQTYSYWSRAVKTMPNSKKIKDDGNHSMITLALMTQFIGLLELWVQGDLSDKDFKVAAQTGIILTIVSFVDKKSHKNMLAYLEVLKKKKAKLIHS